MRVSTSESDAKFLCWKMVGGEEILPQAKELSFSGSCPGVTDKRSVRWTGGLVRHQQRYKYARDIRC